MNAGIFKKAVNTTTLLSFFLWNLAIAAPQGGQVAAGSAAISQSGLTTTVNQSSQSAVINWNSFNTASSETVNFVQPNSSAVALNRINSGLPTQFAGTLNANGQVWILNPAGVVFAGSSNINVSGLLATTHDISNANFMAGNYSFAAVPGFENSKIINYGNITVADTGMVALVAPGVENYGVIQANLGKVALASGTAFVLDLNGDGLINFGNSAPVQNGYVSNAGKIIANGGKVYLTANSAANAVDSVINMSGTIQATTAHNSHGRIILNGGHHGKVKISGKLDASNGGFIETSGESVSIAPSAVINPGKGGTWYVDPSDPWLIDTNPFNGDWADIISNTLSSGSSFTMSGGTIYVLSPIMQYINNGFVLLNLDASGGFTIAAPITLINGELLLTGYSVLVTAAAISVTGGPVYLGSYNGDVDIGGAITVNNGSLEILSNFNNVNINGAITVNNGDFARIYAAQNLTINSTVNTTNTYLDIEAGYCWSGCNFGNLTINSGGVITTSGNNVNLSASNAVEIGAPITVTEGDLNVYANGWDYGVITVDSGAPINVTNGDVYFWSYNDVELNDAITVNNGGFEAIGVYGDVEVYAPIMVSDYLDLYAYYDVYTDDGVALTVTNGGLDIEGGYCYWDCSYYGHVTTNGPVSVTNGNAYMYAPDSIYVNDTVDVTNGGLELDTSYYSIHVNGEITISGDHNAYFEAYAGGSVHIDAPISVMNSDGYFCGDYAVDIEAGEEYSWGKDYINYPIMLNGGNMYVYAASSIYVNDMITVTNGGLELDTSYYSIHVNGEITISGDHNAYFEAYAGGSVHIDAPISVMNSDGYFCGDYVVDIDAANEYWWGKAYIDAPITSSGGDVYIYGHEVFLNAGMTIQNGELEVGTTGGGPIFINSSDPIVTDGPQYYDDQVILKSNTVLTSNFDNIYFYSTVDSGWCAPADLIINVLNGTVYFDDYVGDNNPLNNLMINGQTQFEGFSAEVISVLSQIYNGPVVADDFGILMLTIENGAIVFNDGMTVEGPFASLVSGADANGGGIFGSVNVGYILYLGGTGGSNLINTFVNGMGGLDAWNNIVIEDGSTGLYCVNGFPGGCASFTPPDINLVTSAQTFVEPNGASVVGTNWSMTMVNGEGNSEVCDSTGCVILVQKTS